MFLSSLMPRSSDEPVILLRAVDRRKVQPEVSGRGDKAVIGRFGKSATVRKTGRVIFADDWDGGVRMQEL